MIVLYKCLIQLPDVRAEIALTVTQSQTAPRDWRWTAQIYYPRLVFSSEAIRITTMGEYILSPSLLMAVLLGDLKVGICVSSFVMECEIYALKNLLYTYYGSRAGAAVESIAVGIGWAKWFYDIARQTRTKFQSETCSLSLVEQARKTIPSPVRSYLDLPLLLGDISEQTWSDMRNWCHEGNIARVSECIESILRSAKIDPNTVMYDEPETNGN